MATYGYTLNPGCDNSPSPDYSSTCSGASKRPRHGITILKRNGPAVSWQVGQPRKAGSLLVVGGAKQRMRNLVGSAVWV